MSRRGLCTGLAVMPSAAARLHLRWRSRARAATARARPTTRGPHAARGRRRGAASPTVPRAGSATRTRRARESRLPPALSPSLSARRLRAVARLRPRRSAPSRAIPAPRVRRRPRSPSPCRYRSRRCGARRRESLLLLELHFVAGAVEHGGERRLLASEHFGDARLDAVLADQRPATRRRPSRSGRAARCGRPAARTLPGSTAGRSARSTTPPWPRSAMRKCWRRSRVPSSQHGARAPVLQAAGGGCASTSGVGQCGCPVGQPWGRSASSFARRSRETTRTPSMVLSNRWPKSRRSPVAK